MSSNLYGGHAGGANYSHRNAVFRSPASFNSWTGPAGSISFLLCKGNMRAAIHDGKTCGGVAHWPLFHPSCDFQALYDLIDCPQDMNTDGDTDVVVDPPAEPTICDTLDLVVSLSVINGVTTFTDVFDAGGTAITPSRGMKLCVTPPDGDPFEINIGGNYQGLIPPDSDLQLKGYWAGPADEVICPFEDKDFKVRVRAKAILLKDLITKITLPRPIQFEKSDEE